MSQCPSEETLHALHAGELDEERAAAVRAHLERCSHCVQRAASLQARHDDLVRHVQQLGVTEALPEPGKAVEEARTSAVAGLSREAAGDRVGPYTLLERVGEGGFGVVWLAQQSEPLRRRVALKILKLGMDTERIVARFEAERQALALMDHSHVARVYDAGATERGRPYFVMEYVAGEAITSYCDRHKLGTRGRLDLFMAVCHAVQHAHQKGIIHRDLKPSNVLVTLQDGKPVPKVIDFGVAKAVDQRLSEQTIFTEQGQLLGTPEYMSPEQAEMSGLNIDTRTDVYSLGVLLYELLTGVLPFDSDELRRADYAGIQRLIREQEPRRPSTRLSGLGDDSALIADNRRTDAPALISELRGDLDWIIMKALEKDRTRRYGTAAEFAADVQRHLRHEVVLASPPSTTYRLRKFVRRNRTVVIAGAVTVLALVGGIVGTGWMAVIAAEQRVVAEEAHDEEQTQRGNAEASAARARREAAKAQAVNAYLREMLVGVSPFVGGHDVTLQRVVDQAALELESGTLTGQPEVEAAVRTTLGLTYESLGLYAEAQSHWRRALERYAESSEDNTSGMGEARAGLGRALYGGGQFEAAEAELRAALKILRDELGDEHPEVTSVEVSIARVLQARGESVTAEQLYRRALERQRRSLGPEDTRVGSTLNNLGGLLQYRGDHAAAEPLLREALAIFRKQHGDTHILAARTLHNLGLNEKSAGDYVAAEAFLREALPILREAHQGHHPDVALCLDSLGQVLHSRGNLAEAEGLHREALAMLRTLHPDGHVHVATALNNLAFLVQSMGKVEEAETLFREAVDVYRQLLGSDHRDLAVTEYNLGILLQERGDFEEALDLFRDNLRITRLYAYPGHPDIATALAGLGGCLVSAGQCTDAEPLLDECVRIRRMLLPNHWLYFNAVSLLGEAHLCLERFESAESLLVDSYEGLAAETTTPRPRLREAVERLARLYEAWDQPDKASNWRAMLAGWTE